MLKSEKNKWIRVNFNQDKMMTKMNIQRKEKKRNNQFMKKKKKSYILSSVLFFWLPFSFFLCLNFVDVSVCVCLEENKK
jgi:hypothetical protein